jgi:hypothetical protein
MPNERVLGVKLQTCTSSFGTMGRHELYCAQVSTGNSKVLRIFHFLVLKSVWLRSFAPTEHDLARIQRKSPGVRDEGTWPAPNDFESQQNRFAEFRSIECILTYDL